MGELAALELKLILRHKRTKNIFYTCFLFLAYGLFFYKQENFERNELAMMVFAAIFITGIFMITYGQYMFGWQSKHFDGLLVNKIDYTNFIKSKFLLFTISSIVSTLLASVYAFINWKILLLQLAAFFFNIGIASVIVLWFATRNYKSMDLNKRTSFNWQGTTAAQWIMSIPLLMLPVFIYLPFALLKKPYWGIITLGLLGIASLFSRSYWIRVITKALKKQKYKIAEGFRE